MDRIRKRQGKKVSSTQKELLVTYLEHNLDLTRGPSFEGPDANRSIRRKWQDLAELLNTEGGATKDGDKWKKIWQDLRSYVKNRAFQIDSSNRNKDLDCKRTLTDLEQRILRLEGSNSVAVQVDQHRPSKPKLLLQNICEIIEDTQDGIKEEIETLDEDSDSNIISTNTIPVVTTDKMITPSFKKKRRQKTLEDVMEALLVEDKKRNELLERQIEVDREKVAAINNLAKSLR